MASSRDITSSQKSTLSVHIKLDISPRTLAGANFAPDRWTNQNNEPYWSAAEIDCEMRSRKPGISLLSVKALSKPQILNLSPRSAAIQPQNMSS